MKNILVAVALAATVVTVQADAASDTKAAACALSKTALDEATKAGVQTTIDANKKAYADLGCGAEALYGSLAAVAVAIYATTF